ncbi:uncharacterized protein LOC123013967 [Tribolium madens]|uniref:uncharacterized protein LOC123013967 n=1 Tax=Tribolium madens TaxID=41895 RepID=UPI001CF75F58|nr:uncharacterized protein LOC123013967 [Tribolium madens]
MPEFTGLQHNEERPHILIVGTTDSNSSSPLNNKNFTYNIPSNTWWPWCDYWKDPQNILFQLANMCFVLAYSSTCSKKGVLFMHCWLILGLMLFSAWAWNIICAPDVFTWNFAFMLMNMAQVFHILYQLRPVKFDPELEEAYHALFEPFKLSRLQYKRMVSAEFAQIMSLHAGEAYAVQNLTRTDRLGLLLSGKVNVLSDNQFLHPILPCEFLDSPEFESSRNTVDDKFKVSIVAASTCRYLYWQRSALEYLFVKDTYVATVLTTLIARDIATKLYAMNNKIVTAKGSHLDIRLPSITSSLTSSGEYKSPIRTKKSEGMSPLSPGTFSNDSRYRSYEKFKENGTLNHNFLSEMEPLTELPSNDDLTSNDVESWLETSSKYHSCEIVDKSMEVPLIQSRTHVSNRVIKTNLKKTMKNFTYLPENTTWGEFYNLTNTSDYDYEFQTFNSTGPESTSWALCKEWTPAQHPLFQTANFFFAAAFLVPGSFKQSVLIVRALLSIGYFFLTLWGGVEVCAPDILLWNSLLVILNLTHTVLLAWKFLPPTLTLELTDLYLKVFKPLRVSRKHFKELVREATVMTLECGDIYAVEDVSPADERLSILLKGKLRVTCDDTHLHFINVHQFVDSPEWESNHEQSDDVFQVTITAEEDSVYLCWPRMKLERVLRHRPVLKVVLDSIIGKDITQKLYALNEHLTGLNDERKRGKRDEMWAKAHNRSMSMDAVNTGTTGLVRSHAYRTSHRKNSLTSEVGSIGQLQNQCWVPLVAKQFPASSPFTANKTPSLKIPEVHNRSLRRKEKDKEVKFENAPI